MIFAKLGLSKSQSPLNIERYDLPKDFYQTYLSRLQKVTAEAVKKAAEKYIKPGGVIIHIGLTQPNGSFDFRKTTLQEVTFIGTYCYTNKDFENTLKLLSNNEIGDLRWIEFRDLSKGDEAFKQIHDGTCSAPKIILIP